VKKPIYAAIFYRFVNKTDRFPDEIHRSRFADWCVDRRGSSSLDLTKSGSEGFDLVHFVDYKEKKKYYMIKIVFTALTKRSYRSLRESTVFAKK